MDKALKRKLNTQTILSTILKAKPVDRANVIAEIAERHPQEHETLAQLIVDHFDNFFNFRGNSNEIPTAR